MIFKHYFGCGPLPVINSDQQDDITFLGSGIPINLHLPLESWEGVTFKHYGILFSILNVILKNLIGNNSISQ